MKRLRDIWDKLPNIEHTRKFIDEKTGLRMYEICGKKFQETVPIEYIIPVLEKYHAEYGERAILASKNLSIDWKAVAHALRAAYQVRELLADNTITFPLKNAEFLRNVKQGKLDYVKVVAPLLEDIMAEVEILSEKSELPEKADRKFWNKFIVSMVGDSL